MSLIFREKKLYHRATRHGAEGYAPVLAPDRESIAFLQADADTETLMLRRPGDQPAVTVSSPGYIFSPCFAGEWLVWAEQASDHWQLRGTRWRETPGESRVLFLPTDARPIHLTSVANENGAWLAWEERRGRKTRIRLAWLNDKGSAGDVRTVDTAGANAYDPALAIAEDGSVYCAFSAYSDDNYRIFLARFGADGRPIDRPIRVSDRSEACVWPSLWPAAGGGVWFSFTSYSIPNPSRPEHNQALSYVKHDRYLRQRQFYGCHGIVHVGRYDGQQLEAPLAGPGAGDLQFFAAAGLVLGSEGAGHSQVLEDARGNLHVLFRHHAKPDPLSPAKPSPPLKAHPDFSAKHPRQMHPNLSIVSLGGNTWQPVKTIVPRAHFDLSLPAQFDGTQLSVAFGEDARLTGWSGGGEWFDDVGEVGLGVVHLEFAEPALEPMTLCPLSIAPFPSGRLTNPHALPAETTQWQDRTYALGQTHCHSNLSICRRELDRDPHFNYRFMQDVQHCRFGMLTDHEYNLWHTEMIVLRKIAEYYYFPGEFVALQGYEWTGSDPADCSHDGGPFGHVNMLCFEKLTAADFHNPCDANERGNSLEKLWHLSAGRKRLTPPHHVVDLVHPYNWNFWNDEFEPFIEIFQDDRGSGEQAGAPGLTNSTRVAKPAWAVDALRSGKRFGFVAGGDHSGVALGGVWTRAFTREALYAALRERACYGTTGTHAAILFTCNGRPMGSEAAGTPAHFELRVGSAASVARVEILRNGELVRTIEGGPDNVSNFWTWKADDARAGDFWYCRIHWADGELAWTSPVWL
jgi:hypothetical protein